MLPWCHVCYLQSVHVVRHASVGAGIQSCYQACICAMKLAMKLANACRLTHFTRKSRRFAILICETAHLVSLCTVLGVSA